MKTKIQDLTDLEFETLADRMFDDTDCITAFIEANYQDFEEWANERGVYPDYYCDHEFNYCEHHDEKFMEFALDYYNKRYTI